MSGEQEGKPLSPHFLPFFPFVLSLVSLAHRGLHAEASNLTLQTRVPGAKWPHRDLSPRVVGRSAVHLYIYFEK